MTEFISLGSLSILTVVTEITVRWCVCVLSLN